MEILLDTWIVLLREHFRSRTEYINNADFSTAVQEDNLVASILSMGVAQECF